MGFLDSTSHVVQLLLALGGGVILFAVAFAGYTRALFIDHQFARTADRLESDGSSAVRRTGQPLKEHRSVSG